LHRDARRNAEAVERFQREAKVAAKVTSEHVARVTDVGAVEGVPYIVMEYLEGSDLGDLIDREGKLSIEDACEVGVQACEALSEVHAAGIVHRDLKPSNLFITRRSDGSPCLKLLDFGISKFTVHPDDAGLDPALTATATIMGSPSYMSPEQLKSTKEVDARTDVWSLGAVLYEALTGKPAFRGETVPQVCAMIASDDPPPPSSLRAGLPEALEKVILACLDKKPEGRPTLVELARVLATFAPPRAQASLERIEAAAGVPSGKPRERSKSRASSGASPAAGARPPAHVARTQASWQEDGRTRRAGGGALLLLVLVAGGVLVFGVLTGRIDIKGIKGIKGDVASAASAVSSTIAGASSIVASASSAIASALPSSIPSTIPSDLPLPQIGLDPSSPSASNSTEPSASGSAAPAASDEPDDEEGDDDNPPAASASGPAAPATSPAAHAPASPRYVAPKKHVHKRRRRQYPRHR
jgi:serine/threonine protein kinase